MMFPIERSVREWLTKHHVSNQHIIVAVSGGVDSITLLHVLAEMMLELQFQLTVAHVDHGLRGIHSDADRVFVQNTCSALDVPCRTTSIDTTALAANSGLGIEATARNARYSFFASVASADFTPINQPDSTYTSSTNKN